MTWLPADGPTKFLCRAVGLFGNALSDVAGPRREWLGKAKIAGSQSAQSLQQIHAATEEVNRITATVGEPGGTLSSLELRSDDVTRIVQVIKGVADQTHLLALNAAIARRVDDAVHQLQQRATSLTALVAGFRL